MTNSPTSNHTNTQLSEARETICGNCRNLLYQTADPNNIHWYHVGTGDVRCPTTFAQPISRATQPSARVAAEEIRDWLRLTGHEARQYATPSTPAAIRGAAEELQSAGLLWNTEAATELGGEPFDPSEQIDQVVAILSRWFGETEGQA